MELVLVVSSILLWILVLFNLLLTLAVARRLNAKTSRDLLIDIPKLERGQQAPDFVAKTLDGSPVSLANYAGRAVAFIFMSPTCSPCREKMPMLNALQPITRRAGVEIVLVSDSDHAETKNFSDDLATSLPILIAPRVNNPFMTDYKANGTPFYCLVAVDGRVQSTGFFDDEWEALVKTWKASQAK